MKANSKSLRSFKKRLSECVLKSNELIEVRGGGDPGTPPIITPL